MLAAELELRRAHGEQPRPDKYFWAVPGHDDVINGLFLAPTLAPDGASTDGTTAEGPGDDWALMALLAYRLGLVGRDALAKSVRDWAPGPRASLVQVLVDRRSLTRESLDRLMAAATLHRGQSPHDADTAVFGAGVVDPGTGGPAVGTATSDGQRFRVLRPHARGGLGAVFVALDTELHREVALKQILDDHADDPTSRQRFLLEAEVTGGLEHPGIVPVYGLGTYGDGRPYYAMRFIRGDSLKEAIERFHADAALQTRPRPAVAGAAQAAAAVHRRLQRHRLRPQPRRAAPRHQAGQHHRRQARRDAGRRLGPGQADGPVRAGVRSGERTLVPSSASGSRRDAAGLARWARRPT